MCSVDSLLSCSYTFSFCTGLYFCVYEWNNFLHHLILNSLWLVRQMTVVENHISSFKSHVKLHYERPLLAVTPHYLSVKKTDKNQDGSLCIKIKRIFINIFHICTSCAITVSTAGDWTAPNLITFSDRFIRKWNYELTLCPNEGLRLVGQLRLCWNRCSLYKVPTIISDLRQC